MSWYIDLLDPLYSVKPDQSAPLGADLSWVHTICPDPKELLGYNRIFRVNMVLKHICTVEHSGSVLECLTPDRGAAG